MIYAEKGNKVLRIGEGDVQRFLSQGYNIKDDNGKVIAETVPTDLQSLKLAYTQHKEKIAELEAEIEKLKAAKKPTEKATKAKAKEDSVEE